VQPTGCTSWEEVQVIEQVERELELEASVEEVWDAVTGDGWLADEVALELLPGGDASFRSGPTEKAGWVEEASPPSASEDRTASLVFWWAAEGESATRVEVTITPGERGTRLRVIESRPLELLDLVGVPLPGAGQRSFGPAMVAA
jgi:uncharacterized protein YndB with AHSA1/START domain